MSEQAKRCRLFENFENLQRRNAFFGHKIQNVFFNKIMLLCINRRLSAIFQENEWMVLEWPVNSPDLNPIQNLWAILKQRLRKQTVFWENLEERVSGIWNKIDADVVRNQYENYTNRLLDVKKAKGVMTSC